MALFIGSRTSVQCRSQNQRLFRKYKNIRNIVASFKEEYGRDKFEEDYSLICDHNAIKFRTEYEKYLENQVKKVAEAATQTERPADRPTTTPNYASGFTWTPQILCPWSYIPVEWSYASLCL